MAAGVIVTHMRYCRFFQMLKKVFSPDIVTIVSRDDPYLIITLQIFCGKGLYLNYMARYLPY